MNLYKYQEEQNIEESHKKKKKKREQEQEEEGTDHSVTKVQDWLRFTSYCGYTLYMVYHHERHDWFLLVLVLVLTMLQRATTKVLMMNYDLNNKWLWLNRID